MLRHPQVGLLGGGAQVRGRAAPCLTPASSLSRSLGVHCSKVRSLTLDSWEPELLKVRRRPSTLPEVCKLVGRGLAWGPG